MKEVNIMDKKTLKYEVARYLYPFLGNTSYQNETYYNSLIKKYGKKVVAEAIKEEYENGCLKNALNK